MFVCLIWDSGLLAIVHAQLEVRTTNLSDNLLLKLVVPSLIQICFYFVTKSIYPNLT